MASNKSNQVPVAMRQAPVKSPSALQEVYKSGTATMSRSKSRIQLVLHDEPVKEKPNKLIEPVKTMADNNCTPEVCDMAEKLKTQVADLSLFLEEERLKHKDTKKRAEEVIEDKINQLTSDHQAALHRQQEEHETTMEAVKAQYQHQIVSERMELNSVIAKLKTEIEILNGAFHSYKSQTQEHHEGELKDWEERLTSTLKSEKESEKKELENLLRYEHNIEINKLERKHQNKLNELKREHKKDVETIKSRYSNHEGDLQELKDTKEKLQDVISQLSAANAIAETFEQQLLDSKLKYSDSKQQLVNHENQLAERVRGIEAKYKDQNDKLLEANSNLRMQYLKKCEELFEHTAQTKVDETISTGRPQLSKRTHRLIRSQSVMEIPELMSRGYTKTLFTQLHVHYLNDELEWSLNRRKHVYYPNSHQSVHKLPVDMLYRSVVLNKKLQIASRFPPLPLCHKTRNQQSLLSQKKKKTPRTLGEKRNTGKDRNQRAVQ